MASLTQDQCARYADGATVIDAGRRTLMPGLIDTHERALMMEAGKIK